MSNDDSTSSSGGEYRDRDRLPPYAATPAGWILPEDTGALELPTTDAGVDEQPAGDLDTDAVTPADVADLPSPDDIQEPETGVIPVISSAQPGDVTRTEAIAGLTAESASSSAPAAQASGPSPVASEEEASESAAALAGTSNVPSRAQRSRGKDPIRTIARGIGQTLITLGVVVLLFVVYEVYVTDLFGEQKQDKVQAALDEKWAQKSDTIPTGEDGTVVPSVGSSEAPAPPAPAALVVDPADRVRNYDTAIGEGFAKIFIPALGSDYEYTIVEGTTIEDLYGSPGHYEDTQYPGELGNFAVAGHRVSKGSPFNALGTLSSCDSIIIETQDDWFVYRLLPMEDEIASWNPASRAECADVKPLDGEYAGLAGREITLPSDYAQVLPVPKVNAEGPAALAAATQRLITLTTCHPQFSDAERMIVHGVLIKSYAKADGFVPPELNEV